MEDYQNQKKVVFIQKKGKHNRDKIKRGDIVFIYETARPKRVIKNEDTNGKREVCFRQGVKGLIAMVRINSVFANGKWSWDGDEYIGSFKTEIIEAKRVSLKTINDALRESSQSIFTPHVPGGIIDLGNSEKAKILERLMQPYVQYKF